MITTDFIKSIIENWENDDNVCFTQVDFVSRIIVFKVFEHNGSTDMSYFFIELIEKFKTKTNLFSITFNAEKSEFVVNW